MTTYDLDGLTLEKCGLSASDENRGKLSAFFLQAYNEAYADLILSRIKPSRWEQAFAMDHSLDLTLLQRACVSVLEVKDDEPSLPTAASLPFLAEGGGRCTLPTCQSAIVWVRYRYLPTPLTNGRPTIPVGNDSVPELPEHAQGALCDYAAAVYWNREGKQERAEAAMTRYWQVRESIPATRTDAESRITGKWR